MKRAVVTGATGPLGIALASHLAKHGVQVAAIVNPESNRIADVPASPRVKIIPCDLRELARLQYLLTGSFDTFFYLAWGATESRATRDDPAIHASNIVYTLDAVKLAHALGCTTFVGAGSQVELAGIAPNAPAPGEESYGIAKYAAGRLSARLCGQLGMRQCWARVQSIYGPGERETTALMYCIHTLLKGEKPSFTKGEQLWDYLYSADCARALYLIADRGRHGAAYSVGSGMERPLRTFFECTRDCIDPALPLGLGDKEYPPGQPMRVCADIRTLSQDTGFMPEYSFEQGIRETIEWVRNKMK
jgi:nucleoside-diphosphate-sugar epimerase